MALASCPTEAEVASALEVWLAEPLSSPRLQELHADASDENPFLVPLYTIAHHRVVAPDGASCDSVANALPELCYFMKH